MGRNKKPLDEAEIIKSYHRKFAGKGGKARAEKLSPARRAEIAKKGARKRWEKRDAVLSKKGRN